MFGSRVVERIAESYTHALLTAHLEVPGEMFALASEAQRNGRGVVGSTSRILGFICDRVDRALTQPGATRIPVVLGTEAGMITGIVRSVQDKLRAVERSDVEVEIVFPVAAEAIARAPESELKLVPGVASGEGCSVAGGCATCPFMKMNTLDSLFHVLDCVAEAQESALAPFRPREYAERMNGKSVSELGTIPILQMRHFQKAGNLSDELVASIQNENAVREDVMSAPMSGDHRARSNIAQADA
jgi:quinolinate synthase